MTRVQAFLMSLLSRQLTLAQEAFLTRYPACWLVWEPGEWSVPVHGVDVSVAETKLPNAAARELRPLGGDALCFSLKAPEGTQLKLGRSADNEIVVSDMTVSAERPLAAHSSHRQQEDRAQRQGARSRQADRAAVRRRGRARRREGDLLRRGGVQDARRELGGEQAEAPLIAKHPPGGSKPGQLFFRRPGIRSSTVPMAIDVPATGLGISATLSSSAFASNAPSFNTVSFDLYGTPPNQSPAVPSPIRMTPSNLFIR